MFNRELAKSSPAIPMVLAICALTVSTLSGCQKRQAANAPATAPQTVQVKSIEDQWKDAALKVEEDRNEPAGSHASVRVPGELKHYVDSHRFLGIQEAESRKQGMEMPRDLPDLAPMIEHGLLVEMDRVNDDYVLFGVGGIVGNGPVTHYDPQNRVSVPIFASDQEFAAEDAKLADEITRLQSEIAGLQREIRFAKSRDKIRRRSLLSRIAAGRGSLASATQSKDLMDSYYSNPKLREVISADYQAVAKLASNFGGKSYDLTDPSSRQEFKVRMLSFVRPQARAVIEEIAAAYKAQFGRPLPITSLVRTEEYQHNLSEKNPNAARNAVPPHTTGLAFDVYYHFMTAAEQDFLMTQIAALKDAGKVEALRETRDHFHVFAFADGSPPAEDLIAKSVERSGPTPHRTKRALARPAAGRRAG
ncbi:MAG TPA: DUF5715 family protein [Blastocatellia bacterium]|nr:DUF5715 family protein [Blastocatellia bacterium]